MIIERRDRETGDWLVCQATADTLVRFVYAVALLFYRPRNRKTGSRFVIGGQQEIIHE